MKINSIIDLVKDLDTSRQTKNLNKLLIRILLHLQVEFSKHKKAYNAKSHYLPHVRPVSQNLQIDLFKTIHDRGLQPHYHHLMYDKYRKVFYRFALMPDDNIKPFSNNPHQSFSIIILNKDYEIIGETKFPGNTYAHHLCLVGKKGLYISENNENNPQFDENKLVFRCFTLQGRKK